MYFLLCPKKSPKEGIEIAHLATLPLPLSITPPLGMHVDLHDLIAQVAAAVAAYRRRTHHSRREEESAGMPKKGVGGGGGALLAHTYARCTVVHRKRKEEVWQSRRGRKSAIRGGNRYDNNNNGGFIENPLGKFAGVLAPETANCVPLSAGPKKKKSRSHN